MEDINCFVEWASGVWISSLFSVVVDIVDPCSLSSVCASMCSNWFRRRSEVFSGRGFGHPAISGWGIRGGLVLDSNGRRGAVGVFSVSVWFGLFRIRRAFLFAFICKCGPGGHVGFFTDFVN